MPVILYRNDTSKKIVLPVTGDVIEAGSTISVSGEYPQPINHPGLTNITNETTSGKAKDEDA